MSYKDFINKICENSLNKNPKEALVEWEYQNSGLNQDWSNCICGHRIKELCFIWNKSTQKELIIGNCCVKLIGEKPWKLASAIKRGKINPLVIDEAFVSGKLNEKERNFLFDVWNKRTLSPKQASWRSNLIARLMCCYFKDSENADWRKVLLFDKGIPFYADSNGKKVKVYMKGGVFDSVMFESNNNVWSCGISVKEVKDLCEFNKEWARLGFVGDSKIVFLSFLGWRLERTSTIRLRL